MNLRMYLGNLADCIKNVDYFDYSLCYGSLGLGLYCFIIIISIICCFKVVDYSIYVILEKIYYLKYVIYGYVQVFHICLIFIINLFIQLIMNYYKIMIHFFILKDHKFIYKLKLYFPIFKNNNYCLENIFILWSDLITIFN